MEKYYTITYQVYGSIATDYVKIWASSIEEAISEFLELPLIENKYTYTEHAILSIICK